MKIILVFLLLLAASAPQARAQSIAPEVLAVGGAYLDAGGFSLSATLGEMAVATLSDATATITQGFQQPSQIAVRVTETNHAWHVDVFPNPTADIVYFQLKNLQQPLRVEIFDQRGIRCYFSVETGSGFEIDISAWMPGAYFYRLGISGGAPVIGKILLQ